MQRQQAQRSAMSVQRVRVSWMREPVHTRTCAAPSLGIAAFCALRTLTSHH